MNTIEKFNSDAEKASKKQAVEFDDEIVRLFLRAISLCDKRLTDLANDFVDYWLDKYASPSLTAMSKGESIEWFLKILSFLTGGFEKDMDFNQEDWEQIGFIVSASANELDMKILNSLMMILVERKML